MSNTSTMTLFNTLDELVNARNALEKRASDGFNSSMPEDSNDGLTEPKEGPLSSEMSKDLKSPATNLSNVEDKGDASYSEDSQKDGLGTVDVSEADEGDHSYNFKQPDPGTSMPANAENAEKYASYSFAENFAEFNKLAAAWENTPHNIEYQTYEEYPVKQASYNADNDQDRVRKLAAIIEMADQHAQIFAKAAQYSFKKLAEGEDITPDDVIPALDGEDPTSAPAEEEAPADLGTEDLSPEDAAAIQEIVDAVESGEISPEELDALLSEAENEDAVEKEASLRKCAAYQKAYNAASHALSQLKPEDAQTLASLPFSKLAELSEGIDAAGAEDGGDISPEDQAVLESMSDEELQALADIAEAIDAGVIDPNDLEAITSGEPDVAPEGGDLSEDEALGELSSAMMEQGLDPDDLEAADVPEEKQASLKAVTSMVRNLRKSGNWQYKQARPGTTKYAVRQTCHQFLNELFN